jgi:serine/threonine-protein kinase
MSAGSTPSRLTVLLFSDIVGSTDLKSDLGTPAYAKLLEQHNRLFESALRQVAGAEVVKHTGDGYFAVFPTASDAVRAALVFQCRMAQQRWGPHPFKTRVGIHIGEVAIVDMAGRKDVVGFSADVAARLMSLATGGQILLTATAFNDARQFVSEVPESLAGAALLRWIAHGSYSFKGADEPLDVFEVGIAGISPLVRPPDSEKARRAVAYDQEQTLGWRPALGLDVPTRSGWKLQRQLGEGGFGEVWLAQHDRTKDHRVFKFCFDAERLRSFKRELTLFRLLRDALGDRDDIAKLHEVKLDEPPYFLESEYTEGGNLSEWAGKQRGIDQVPLETRLEIVAKIANAVAAAHSVGILHKDIKPANILIHVDRSGVVHPRLSDFGIGMLRDRRELHERGITASGLTLVTEMASGTSGTPLYSPPELLAGYPFSIQGDIYALGVVLYQMVVGDLEKPLGQKWERDVSDELLREDIGMCVDGDSQRRSASAATLAQKLRGLEDRRAQLQRERNATAETARRARLVRVSVGAAVVLAFLLTVCAVGGAIYINQIKAEQARNRAQRQEAEIQRAQSERRRKEAENAEAAMQAANQFINDLLASANPYDRGRNVTVLDALNSAAARVEAGELRDRPEIEAAVRLTIGQTYKALGEFNRAEPHLRAALDLYRREHGGECTHIASCLDQLGLWAREQGKLDDAEKHHEQALEMRRKLLGDAHLLVAASMNNLALALQDQKKFAESESLLRETLAINRKLLGEEHADVATNLNNLGTLLHQQGELQRAESIFRESLSMRRKLFRNSHPDLAFSLDNLASCLQDQTRFTEAEEFYREGLAIRRAHLGEAHPEIATSLNNLASLLMAQSRLTEAESLLREALSMDRQLLKPYDERSLLTSNNLISVLCDQGRLDEAISLAREKLDIESKAFGENSLEAAESTNAIGGVLYTQKKFSEAEAMWRETVTVRRQLLPADDVLLAQALNNLARVRVEQGRHPEAEPDAREALRIRQKSLPDGHWLRAASASLLGDILRAQKNFQQAEPLLLEGFTGMSNDPATPPKRRREVLERVIRLYEDWAKPEQATRWRNELAALDATTRPTSSPANVRG